MGIIRDDALESIHKTDVLQSTEFMMSKEGRRLIADALIYYLNDPFLENDRH